MKSLRDISWPVTEEVYRDDKALSYSTLSTFQRLGFNGLDKLFDRKESPSLTFGSAVDSIITGGQEEFDSRFFVGAFPEMSDALEKIITDCFNTNHIIYKTLSDIPDSKIIEIAANYNYQNNWKPETRAKVIKEKGEEFYNLLYLSEGKTVISDEMYADVLNCVRALRESDSTKYYFAPNNPFDNTIERFYQLKFKTELNGVIYRCMADLLIVDHKNKIITPVDLKTSSHTEWDFYRSFVDWNYQIQARLYWRIIRKIMNSDDYFKDFTLADYIFIVINKHTLIPLVWEFKDCTLKGELVYGINNNIVMPDPESLGKQLFNYLNSTPKVPDGIKETEPNNLCDWLNTL